MTFEVPSPVVPTATATPDLTSAGIPPAFRTLVGQVDAALAARDIDFFRERAATEHIVCTLERVEALGEGRPDCDSVGQEYAGFALGAIRGGINILPLDDALDHIREIFNADPSSSDDFGGAQARVYASGIPHAAWVIEDGHTSLLEEPGYGIVVTGIVDRPRPGTVSGPTRVALVLNWAPAGGGFRLVSLLHTRGDYLDGAEALWPVWELQAP